MGLATCGIASGALETKKAFEEALANSGVEARIHTMGCIGHCYAEPVVIIENPGFPPIFYPNVTPGKARMLVRSFLEKGDPLFEHLLGATEENEMIPQVWDFPRFSQEKRIVMEKCGIVDPESMDDYIARGGYGALAKALQMDRDEIIRVDHDRGPSGQRRSGFSNRAEMGSGKKDGRSQKNGHL